MKKNIGEKIREIRCKKKLSQLDIKVLTKPTICRIERGDKPYLVSNLLIFLNALNTKLLLVKGHEVVEVENKQDISATLQRWRENKTLYSIAKSAGVDWRRFKEIESCANYGIDSLIGYIVLFNARIDVMSP